MNEILDGFPLQWPQGWSRTEYKERSRFNVTHGKAVQEVLNEIKLLGGTQAVISSNLQLRSA